MPRFTTPLHTDAYHKATGQEPQGDGRWEFELTYDTGERYPTVAFEGSWSEAVPYVQDIAHRNAGEATRCDIVLARWTAE